MDEKKHVLTIQEIEIFEKFLMLKFNENKRKLMQSNLDQLQENFKKLREYKLDNSIRPALVFNPLVYSKPLKHDNVIEYTTEFSNTRPDNLEDLAYASISELAFYIKNRIVSVTELVEMYIQRIERYDPKLRAVITLTKDYALKQAKLLDDELKEGKYRGPLHGLPFGVKDLLAHPDFLTTWGATPYKEQLLNQKAKVIERLEEAGGVMIAKLSLGALAWGDIWFDATTKSPWNLDEGSSGSSAGSASATAAGLVAFSIGSETYGSIVSPSTKCGTIGLRPGFGRVSKYGAMALSWSMDKLGPICRYVEDCALVFNEIYGYDENDISTIKDQSFSWQKNFDIKSLKIGYLKEAIKNEEDEEFKENDSKVIKILKEQGLTIKEIDLPDFPTNELSFILWAEAATQFENLTISGEDDTLVSQIEQAWPNYFRSAHFIPAVQYIKANRMRSILMKLWNELFSEVDVLIAPSFSDALISTNLTGHPAVVVPTGFRKENNIPTSITFIADHMNEEYALQVAKLYQMNSEFYKKTPQEILNKAISD